MKLEFNLWTIATLVLLFLFLWHWQCKPPKEKVVTKTVVQEVKVPFEVVKPGPEREVRKEIPVKVPVYVRVPVPGPGGETIYKIDTLFEKVDSAKILQDYYTERVYNEQFPFDQDGVKGKILVNSTISENRLQLQNGGLEMEVQHKETEQRRTVLLLGIDALGNKEKIFQGAGANLFLKDKRNRMYGAGVKKIDGIPLLFEAGVKMPISFR